MPVAAGGFVGGIAVVPQLPQAITHRQLPPVVRVEALLNFVRREDVRTKSGDGADLREPLGDLCCPGRSVWRRELLQIFGAQLVVGEGWIGLEVDQVVGCWPELALDLV